MLLAKCTIPYRDLEFFCVRYLIVACFEKICAIHTRIQLEFCNFLKKILPFALLSFPLSIQTIFLHVMKSFEKKKLIENLIGNYFKFCIKEQLPSFQFSIRFRQKLQLQNENCVDYFDTNQDVLQKFN